jgi:hypothetical protein
LDVRSFFPNIFFIVDTSSIDSAGSFSACGSPLPAPSACRRLHPAIAPRPLVECRIVDAVLPAKFTRRQSGSALLQTLMIRSSVNRLLRVICLLDGEQNPNSEPSGVSGEQVTGKPLNRCLNPFCAATQSDYSKIIPLADSA